jgi:hypothetical protein
MRFLDYLLIKNILMHVVRVNSSFILDLYTDIHYDFIEKPVGIHV